MKKLLIVCLLFLSLGALGEVYYTSPVGTEKNLSKVTRNNPADYRWITQFEGSQLLKCGDSVLFRWDQGIYTEGTRIQSVGCSDTYQGAIHYLSEPGGFAIFKIKKFPNNNPKSLERFNNPSGVAIGGESYSTGANSWNKKTPDKTKKGRYTWIREIVVVGNFGDKLPKRDLGSIDMPYGNTGLKAAGTIAGSQNYDNMTGSIGIGAYGCRVINCVFWNLGLSGVGVNSGLDKENATFYGNVITNTGHSGPKKDRLHSVYNQWLSTNEGKLIHQRNIYQFSAEEQLQIWSQSGVLIKVNGKWKGANNFKKGDVIQEYRSKVDNIDLIENVMINGGGMSGKKHPKRTAPNSKIGGYTFDENIRIIGNISWHDQGNSSWQSGYSLNGGNDRRNFLMKDNYFVGNGVIVKNLSSIKDVSNNVFVRLSGNTLNFQVRGYHENKYDHSKWFNNQYYNGGKIGYVVGVSDIETTSSKTIDFKKWQDKGFDKYSTYSKEMPPDLIKYFPNGYLSLYESQWKGHFVVLNFSEKNEVIISVDDFGLNPGDIFRVVDVQNISSDVTGNYIYEGSYTKGMQVVIPTEHKEAVKDPTGEMINPTHTDKRFFTGLIINTSAKKEEKPVADIPVKPSIPEKPFEGKVIGAVLDEKCLTIQTSGDVERVDILPKGNEVPHVENSAPWTICDWDFAKIGYQPEGKVEFEITLVGPEGESLKETIFIDYPVVEIPEPPTVLPIDKELETILNELKEGNKSNLDTLKEVIELINKILFDLEALKKDVNRKREFEEK